MTTTKWRMTLDELCHLVDVNAHQLDRWASLGAFGPRWRERRDQGKWRHISKETAQRAVIMAALTRSGFQPIVAAALSAQHRRGAKSDLVFKFSDNVSVTIKREDLP